MSEGELLIKLWEASLSGSVIILAVLLLRILFQSRTPRQTFCLLWDLALVRLLIPGALPSPVSIWQCVPLLKGQSAEGYAAEVRGLSDTARTAMIGEITVQEEAAALPGASPDMGAVLTAVWLAAALALAAWFLGRHLRSCRLYADSLPCKDAFVREWLAAHPLHRRMQVRTSDRIPAPLTYGVLHPVILLPAGMKWADRTALSFVLEHEYQHIRRFDTLRKALLTAAVCLHWFNPLCWVMYVLCNRDMELACDEAVTAQGADRAAYARTLLNMEEQRGRWRLSGSHFSRNALEERIKDIMKHKPISIAALIAVLVVMSITTTVVAAAAPEVRTETLPVQSVPETGHADDRFPATEGEVMIRAQGGEEQVSEDGGRTWLSAEEYRARQDGGDLEIEWWTAEDYAVWLEEEKQALQGILGERGYISSEGWFIWDQKRVDEAIALYEKILEDIKNGARYSKTITDKSGGVIEGAMLSSGTLAGAETQAFEEEAAVPEMPDEAALREELKAFGIGGEANRMSYSGQLVRCFVDGVPVEDNGYAVRYVYTNPDGVLDVHTLRAALYRPDGSYDPMGELTGVAATGEPGFDQRLIDSATFSGSSAQALAETRTENEEEIGAALEPYKAFGLDYEFEKNSYGELRMSWNGKAVHSLYDTETGVWFANNMHGTELGDDAVDLETIYRAGRLCGLQESQPPHKVIHAVEASDASGSGAEEGRTFEEIFAQFQPFGLSFTPRENGMGSLSWNDQIVKSFADLKPDGGVFSYQDPYAESGLRVYTQYDAEGCLTGLRTE